MQHLRYLLLSLFLLLSPTLGHEREGRVRSEREGVGRSKRDTQTMQELANIYGYQEANWILWVFYGVIDMPTILQQWTSANDYSYLCPYLNLPLNNCTKTVRDTYRLQTQILVAYFNTRCCKGGSTVNGGWSGWTEWGGCSASCSPGGVRSRVRTCNNPSPYGGGLYCSGDSRQTELCNAQQSCVPINGNWGTWGSWGTCSATCRGGTQTRSRVCDNPAPANGGVNCMGSSAETQMCNTLTCGVVTDGQWGQWGGLGTCSASCGTGTQTRNRVCNNPAPANGGADCTGTSTQIFYCNTQTCPSPVRDGNWGEWGNMTACSVTCGTGTQTRTRQCNNPAPANGGANCTGYNTGANTQIFYCYLQACLPINGNWGTWGSWGTCSATCGGGSQTRTRACDNPAPANGGATCPGSSLETQMCSTQTCVSSAVNGNWSAWGNWSTCGVTCGGGTQTRTRLCNNPTPANGGAYCIGSSAESQMCNIQTCSPVIGNWGAWSLYGACSVTCGGGSQTRTRLCNNPAPANGGANCVGSTSESLACNTQTCPVNGNWTTWGAWGTCSVTCGNGTQTRTRLCTNPAPAFGGASCSGTSTETQMCTAQSCPIDGNWTTWGSWGTCSVTCGSGTQTRTRSCTNPAPAFGGASCSGTSTETQMCPLSGCPINGNWGAWSLYGTCSVTCGGGTQTRTRLCNNPAPANGGANCVGSTSESLACNNQTCPIDGFWSTWGAWGTCSVTCDSGTRTRTRSCTNPAPAFGGASCSGPFTETLMCTSNVCPINGVWGTWGSWGSCSVTCGGGSQTRTRLCNNPPPSNGGVFCPDLASETTSCNTFTCFQRSCGRYTSTTSGRIVGGQPATLGEYPWIAQLAFQGTPQCACSVVDQYHVITAGHCLDDKVLNGNLNSNAFEVIAGQYNRTITTLEPGAQRVRVISGLRHQNYNSLYLINDVAVLRLETPLTFNDVVMPICLPAPSDVLPAYCTVIGWGSLSYTGDVSKVLLEVGMDAYNSTECARVFQATTPYNINTYLTEGVMCAANGLLGGKDACRGDSGSSLVTLETDANGQYWKQFGIVSSGFGCAGVGQPGFYTYLPYYVNWVYSTIGQLSG